MADPENYEDYSPAADHIEQLRVIRELGQTATIWMLPTEGVSIRFDGDIIQVNDEEPEAWVELNVIRAIAHVDSPEHRARRALDTVLQRAPQETPTPPLVDNASVAEIIVARNTGRAPDPRSLGEQVDLQYDYGAIERLPIGGIEYVMSDRPRL